MWSGRVVASCQKVQSAKLATEYFDASGRKSSEIFINPGELVCSVWMKSERWRLSLVETMLPMSFSHLALSTPRWGVPKNTTYEVR